MSIAACLILGGTSIVARAEATRVTTDPRAGLLGSRSPGMPVTLGVVQPDGVSVSAARAAGFRAVIVQGIWSSLQPDDEYSVDPTALADFRRRIDVAHQAGLSVVMELALQYPPRWALTKIPPFQNQHGQLWIDPRDPGMNVRDWVWTQVGRAAVHNFVRLTLRALGPTSLRNVERVRLGGGYYDELQYPPVGRGSDPSWWSYGACVMPSAALSPDEKPCPVLGHVPSPTGSWSTADQAYVNWHMHGLTMFMVWLIGQFRDAGWSGPISVMHPGFGLRSDDNPRHTGWNGSAYRELSAQGLNWDDQIRAYSKLSNVWPWSTWLDEVDPHQPALEDSDQAGWRKLAELARKYGVARELWGENTGSIDSAGLSRMAKLAVRAGYSGIAVFTTNRTLSYTASP